MMVARAAWAALVVVLFTTPCTLARTIKTAPHADDLVKAFEDMERVYHDSQPPPSPTSSVSPTVSPSSDASLSASPSLTPSPTSAPSATPSNAPFGSKVPVGETRTRDLVEGKAVSRGEVSDEQHRRYPVWWPQGRVANDVPGTTNQWVLAPHRFPFLRGGVLTHMSREGLGPFPNHDPATDLETAPTQMRTIPAGDVHRYLGLVPLSLEWQGHPVFDRVRQEENPCAHSRSFNCKEALEASVTPSASPPPPPPPSPSPSESDDAADAEPDPEEDVDLDAANPANPPPSQQQDGEQDGQQQQQQQQPSMSDSEVDSDAVLVMLQEGPARENPLEPAYTLSASPPREMLMLRGRQGGAAGRLHGTRPIIDQTVETGDGTTARDDGTESMKMDKCGEWVWELGSRHCPRRPPPSGELSHSPSPSPFNYVEEPSEEENQPSDTPSPSPSPWEREDKEEEEAEEEDKEEEEVAKPSPSTPPNTTPSPTPSVSSTPSASITPDPSETPSFTPSPSASLSQGASPSVTPSISASPSETMTASPSRGASASSSPLPSFSPSRTPSTSVSTSPSQSPAPEGESVTPHPSPSLTPSVSPSLSPSPSPEPADCCQRDNQPEKREIFEEGFSMGFDTGYDAGMKVTYQDARHGRIPARSLVPIDDKNRPLQVPDDYGEEPWDVEEGAW